MEHGNPPEESCFLRTACWVLCLLVVGVEGGYTEFHMEPDSALFILCKEPPVRFSELQRLGGFRWARGALSAPDS